MRVKNSIVTRNRRKKFIKLAKGYYGTKHTVYKTAKEQVFNSLAYAYRDRKNNKRNFRSLWIARISSSLAPFDMNYSTFINGLKKANIDLNRKMLSELSIQEPETFAKIVEMAKSALK